MCVRRTSASLLGSVVAALGRAEGGGPRQPPFWVTLWCPSPRQLRLKRQVLACFVALSSFNQACPVAVTSPLPSVT